MRRTAVTITVVLGLITVWVAKAFLVPIFFGAIVAALLSGMHTRMSQKMSRRWAAALLTLASLVVVFLPMGLLTFSGVRTAIKKVREFQETAQVDTSSRAAFTDTLMQIPAVDLFIDRIGNYFRMDTQEIVASAEGFLQRGGLWLADFLTKFLSTIPQFVVELFLVLLAIYFVLVDGPKLSRFFREHSVFPPAETNEIMTAFHELCRSVLLATLVSGLGQALTFMIGLLIVGANGVPLITLLIFLFSFIPLFGAAPITVGFTLLTFLTSDRTSDGVILLIFAGLTGIVDNFIKPAVLKGAANLHPLIALIALFGGLEVFGFTGVFLGPLAVGMFLVTFHCLLRTAPKDYS